MYYFFQCDIVFILLLCFMFVDNLLGNFIIILCNCEKVNIDLEV